MEDQLVQDNPGILTRLTGIFRRNDDYEEVDGPGADDMSLRPNYRYTVTVRRQIQSFDDAMAAANGLKRGELQLLNLSTVDPLTKQKIVDFMSGVNYAQDGAWEEVGQDVYLIAPNHAFVEVAPATPRSNALKN